MAAGTMMYDIHGQAWMEDLLVKTVSVQDCFRILRGRAALPERSCPETAKELGLGTDVVAVGAQDRSAAYGGGASSNGL